MAVTSTPTFHEFMQHYKTKKIKRLEILLKNVETQPFKKIALEFTNPDRDVCIEENHVTLTFKDSRILINEKGETDTFNGTYEVQKAILYTPLEPPELTFENAPFYIRGTWKNNRRDILFLTPEGEYYSTDAVKRYTFIEVLQNFSSPELQPFTEALKKDVTARWPENSIR